MEERSMQHLPMNTGPGLKKTPEMFARSFLNYVFSFFTVKSDNDNVFISVIRLANPNVFETKSNDVFVFVFQNYLNMFNT